MSFGWNAGSISAAGAVFFCGICKRVVLAQVLNETKLRAKELLSGIKCHENRLWSIYGLEFTTPEGMLLKAHIFKSGFIKLDFLGFTGTMSVERWGLASNFLGGSTLEEWFKKTYVSRFKQPVFKIEKTGIKQHEGIRAVVEKKKSFLERVFKVKTVINEYLIWVCKETNKIFVVSSVSFEKQEDILNETAGSIKCL